MKQTVLVLDQATGQYVQKEMTLALDPARATTCPSSPKPKPKPPGSRSGEAQGGEGRRQGRQGSRSPSPPGKADALRDERAERARRNDSILGRIKNTTINTATRTVVSQLTRGLLGGLIKK
jgi:hypothetical protein